MERNLMGEYDVIVIRAGHAGCEAALAASRLGSKTLIFSGFCTLDEYFLDRVGLSGVT